MKRVWVDVKGRPCDGCTKCCEGFLVTSVMGIPIGPGKPCRFVQKGHGCGVHDARPFDPCKVFQCHWKENNNIPEWLKPSNSRVILLLKHLSPYNYIRIVKTGVDPDPKVYDWAKEYAKNGAHLISYDYNILTVYSQDEKFIELATKELSIKS
jgi:hypothetical protein